MVIQLLVSVFFLYSYMQPQWALKGVKRLHNSVFHIISTLPLQCNFMLYRRQLDKGPCEETEKYLP